MVLAFTPKEVKRLKIRKNDSAAKLRVKKETKNSKVAASILRGLDQAIEYEKGNIRARKM